MADKKLMKKKMKLIEHILKGGYDDKVVDEVVYEDDYDSGDRRESQARADVKARMSEARAMDEIASTSMGKQDQAYKDLVDLSNEMKEKIREVANMNTMGNVQLGLGEAWYQGQGKLSDDHLACPHCGAGILVNKLKKKLHKRKVRRNAAKGKPAPIPPKFMRKKGEGKKKPGPKKGGAKSEKQSEWMKYCKAVGKTPKMQGKPWNEVMKKASKLKKDGVSIADIKSVA